MKKMVGVLEVTFKYDRDLKLFQNRDTLRNLADFVKNYCDDWGMESSIRGGEFEVVSNPIKGTDLNLTTTPEIEKKELE